MSTNNKFELWPETLSVLSSKTLDKIVEENKREYEILLRHESILLSPASKNLLKTLYIPFANWITQQPQPFTLGINGAQGSGKTTFAKILAKILINSFNKSVVIISIDDLYLTKKQRLQLSKTIHPLLATRGVPGTHDVELGLNILKSLKNTTDYPIYIPTFNKAIDDRNHKQHWQTIASKPDIIIFEGWCVGALAEDKKSLATPINDLEKNEDQHCQWRQYVNNQLKNDYQTLFSEVDELVMLKIPNYEKTFEWRALQESKLKESTRGSRCMSEKEIKHFTMHFERITRYTLCEMPSRARLIFEIDNEHSISNICYK